jgi:hypothetical protein
MRLCITGNIASARNFEGDKLYMHYLLELPTGWHFDEKIFTLESAYTQSSTCVYDDETGSWVARFGHPIEAEIIGTRLALSMNLYTT